LAGEARKSTSRQVLVIDDDADVCEMVARTVAKAGFGVDTAHDGEEGWKALCVTKYDLVITDHHMPGLTGLKLIERLRSVSVEPPCILISGAIPGSEPALRRIVHPDAILEKPFSPCALIERIYDIMLHGDFQQL
jgi:two-component system OmpR family response regulator